MGDELPLSRPRRRQYSRPSSDSADRESNLLEQQVRDDLLELSVLLENRAHRPHVLRAPRAELLSPPVERRLGDAERPADRHHRRSGSHLAERLTDLLVRELAWSHRSRSAGAVNHRYLLG